MRSMPIEPGTRLGRYRIEDKLGAGGMGVIWSAWDEDLRRRVAIKFLHGGDADGVVAEARAMAAVRHPNVVTVYAVERYGPRTFVVMERIDGTPLDALLADNGPFEVRAVLPIVQSVASALEAVHEVGLLHGDVKPSNVLIEKSSGRVVVTDFGLSKHVDISSQGGSVRGTAEYLAPERACGHDVPVELIPRQDVYALACTVFELLTGHAPYEHSDVHRVLWSHVHAEVPRASDRRRSIGWRVDGALACGLAKDPAKRTATPCRLARDLALAVDRGGGRARVLVVEDDFLERQFLATALAKRMPGVIFQSASDGESGYRAVVAQPPDLVILDLAMPHMNGIELAATLRATPSFASIPIIVSSGAVSTAERRILSRLGVTDWLEKPVSPLRIVERIRTLLGLRAVSISDRAESPVRAERGDP